MEHQTKHSLEQVLAAISRAHTKSGTALALGCARNTVLAYARRWKCVADAFESQKCAVVDDAQEGLREAVMKREPWAITFTLRTLGKDEGYTERHEVQIEIRRQAEQIAKLYDLTVEEVLAEAQSIVRGSVGS